VSVTAAKGFVAAGVACGIKANGDPDLALIATHDNRPVAAAGVFTSNKATAAPVQVTRSHLEETGGMATAVVLNSGNANAATGAAGREDAERTCVLVANELAQAPEMVLVCSTGLIGIPLPMGALEDGVPQAARALRPDGGSAAAEAIRTTDTVRKEVVVDGPGFTVGGMAKGAAMLAPNMATMLAVLTTDAVAGPELLQGVLAAAVEGSFNALSVDGCTSTNDTVLLLASGISGVADDDALADAVHEACADLARQMAGDAEGASKVVDVRVVGAASDEDARRAARKVAESQLCKCSWYGEDPYWGRIVSELGSSGAAFDPDRVAIAYGGITVCRGGVSSVHDATALSRVMGRRHIEVVADLGLGDGTALVLTNDLTHAYIDENMRTS
jgi:glutamate N-acetyltransferase/amino-acid N-acetyltransferase